MARKEGRAIRDHRAEAAALERQGRRFEALQAYERALAEAPDDAEVLAEVAALALRMDQPAVAEPLYARLLALQPMRLEAVDGLTRALRDQHRYADAIAVARPALQAHPADARLWNTLGAVVNQQGDSANAVVFFEEAARLNPALAAARYNLGGARMDLGELARAGADLDAAQALAVLPAEQAMIAFARAQLLLARGELAAGWATYETRLSPDLPHPMAFAVSGARWTPQTPLEGRSLLAVGEQGLGDEVMFANVIAEVLAALGPSGRLALAVEPRLVALFRRSFPDAQVGTLAGAHVGAHADAWSDAGAVRSAPQAPACELWTPLASLCGEFRRDIARFPPHAGFLTPDAVRVAHWRGVLRAAGGGPWIGLTWRSGKLSGERRRHYPEPTAWAPLLQRPDLTVVDLQYGDATADRAALEALTGRGMLRLPDVDLMADLDEVAAICCAVDAVAAVPNATAALAGACGAPLWLLGGPAAWPRLGTVGYPWYPQARVFAAERFGAWDAPIAALAQDLCDTLTAG